MLTSRRPSLSAALPPQQAGARRRGFIILVLQTRSGASHKESVAEFCSAAEEAK